MVFQNPYSSLNPRRRVGDQVADGLRRTRRSGTQPLSVDVLLDRVGLPQDMARRFPYQLSGGQRQRIALARALAARPSVIVLDEPLSALDVSVQAQVANLLQRLAQDLRVGMLLISHDLAIVRQVAARTAVMYLGRLVETAPTGERLVGAAAPVQLSADRRDPDRQHRRQASRRTQRGGSRPLPTSARLSVPPALSSCDGAMPVGRSADLRPGRPPAGRLLARRGVRRPPIARRGNRGPAGQRDFLAAVGPFPRERATFPSYTALTLPIRTDFSGWSSEIICEERPICVASPRICAARQR